MSPSRQKHLKRNRVVTHALVFEWEGSDSSLKPLLLTGHQGMNCSNEGDYDNN